jgi:PAS domain S-box-containing protein
MKELTSQQILDSINEGVYVTDIERHIIYWNKAAEQITGWSRTEILGKGCFDGFLCHIDKDGRQLCGKEFCPLHRAIMTGQSSTDVLIVFAQSRDGRRIPMRVNVAPIRNDKGEIIGGVETFQNLSLEYKDIQKTKKIQSDCLVNEASEDPRLSVDIHYAPYDIIGGDFYAINRISENRYAFVLADVAGHGIASALYTMYLNSLWQEYRAGTVKPHASVRKLNEHLYRLMQGGGTFATALCGFLDLKTGALRMASAGGPAPVIYRSSGVYEKVHLTGMPLGMLEEGEFDEVSIKVEEGDHILLFTDGAVEISNAEGVMLDVDHLLNIFQEHDWPGSGIDFKEIETHLLTYSNRIRFKDDLTLLNIGIRNGKREKSKKGT